MTTDHDDHVHEEDAPAHVHFDLHQGHVTSDFLTDFLVAHRINTEAGIQHLTGQISMMKRDLQRIDEMLAHRQKEITGEQSG